MPVGPTGSWDQLPLFPDYEASSASVARHPSNGGRSSIAIDGSGLRAIQGALAPSEPHPVDDLCVLVVGTPAPQGSKTRTPTGMRESSNAVGLWRQDVTAAARRAFGDIGGVPFDGPLSLSVTFRYFRPKSHTKKRRAIVWHSSTPDLSKLIRATEDALKVAGVIVDDARFATLSAQKVYVEPPEMAGATIWVRHLPVVAP